MTFSIADEQTVLQHFTNAERRGHAPDRRARPRPELNLNRLLYHFGRLRVFQCLDHQMSMHHQAHGMHRNDMLAGLRSDFRDKRVERVDSS